MTANELERSRRLANYFIYLVFSCRQSRPEVICLTADQVSLDSLTPLNYKANLTLG